MEGSPRMAMGRVDLERLVSLPVRTGFVVAPDGRHVAFHSTKTGVPELYVLDLTTGTVRRASGGATPANPAIPPVWAPDGSAVFFTRDRDGDEQFTVHRLTLVDGIVADVVTGPGQHFPMEVSPDGRLLALGIVGAGRQLNLHVVPVEGGVPTRLTDFAQPVRGGFWHPSGQWIVFGANDTEDLENGDMWRVSPDGGTPERFFSTGRGALDGCGRFSRDGKLLAVGSNATGVWRPGVLRWDTGEVTWYGDGRSDEAAMGLTADGRWLITILDRDGVANPVLYDVAEGSRRSLVLPPGLSALCESVLGGEALLVAHEDASHPLRLLLYRLSDDTWSEILPAELGQVDATALVDAQHVTYTTPDGFTVGAVLYRPREIDPRRGNPALVDLHGGPTTHAMVRFNALAQLLADRGYFVLQPNYRGSTGYGVAFERANRGDLGGGDARDVAAGAAFLAALPGVDPSRIALRGVSYGGYLALMTLLRHPEPWAAGVVLAGITDWMALFESSAPHFRSRILQLLGDPARQPELLRDRSPVTHAAALRAPVLMVHGVNDPRCPLEQARRLRSRLLSLGRREGPDGELEYVELDRQGHGSTITDDRTTVWRLQLDFLARRLRGDEGDEGPAEAWSPR